ncbi:hypothetical protein COOONC_17121 [Cooperia oncophora]
MGGGGQPTPDAGFGIDSGGKGMGGGGFKAPSIPGWFWLALIGIIIPLLCCCCCIYCCCCRGKGGGGRSAVPSDGGMGGPGGGMGGGGRAGGGGSMFRNIASSMGGAGIGSILGNLISGRRGGGSRGMGGGGMGMGGYGGGGYGGGDYQGGGAYPVAPGPIYDDNAGDGGRGLYPSKPVKDEGGGGSWA